jgi:hypothetical protein
MKGGSPTVREGVEDTEETEGIVDREEVEARRAQKKRRA